jgi:hypothetical protein
MARERRRLSDRRFKSTALDLNYPKSPALWCRGCKRAKLALARCGLLPPQAGDDQNRRLARIVGQRGQPVSPYTLGKYGARRRLWFESAGTRLARPLRTGQHVAVDETPHRCGSGLRAGLWGADLAFSGSQLDHAFPETDGPERSQKDTKAQPFQFRQPQEEPPGHSRTCHGDGSGP